MYRSHNCGELRIDHSGLKVTLSGWVQKVRDKGGMLWIDLRDRYGITQLIFEEGKTSPQIIELARKVGREYVIQVIGEVNERYAKNPNLETGDIEIIVNELNILNKSETPPFTIENETDGGQELRLKYRYLDLRREKIRSNLLLRHKMMQQTRRFLDDHGFIEVETPVLIKSTPEGARDFVVPSRMNPGQFYALPQSPQTFKQLLMIGGLDKYYQIVKCFRDEDLRADRQPEFTQIDCEMSFVDRGDVIETFQGLTSHLFKEILRIEVTDFPQMTYDEAFSKYGTDKPDLRLGMPFVELNDLAKGFNFNVFDQAEIVVGINVKGCGTYSRKQLDALTEFIRKPQVGAKGLVYVKYLPSGQEGTGNGSFKSSVDKFFTEDQFIKWAEAFGAKPGDLMLILAGETKQTREALSTLRLHLGNELLLKKSNDFKALWVIDFPLLEWDEEAGRYHAMHHPFTSAKPEDIDKLQTSPGDVKANAYDLVINGVEIGGGSIRIHDDKIQQDMFDALGFSKEEAEAQFGFLLNAFKYGAPPHGGIAFGFDRLCALFGGSESIRDYIAFPKNNSGRDVMIDSPSPISTEQLHELSIDLNLTDQ